MRIGVLCSGNLGYELLVELYSQHSVIYVLTDKHSQIIRDFCSNTNIPSYIGNPRNEECKRFVSEFDIDVMASINYLFIIEKEIYSTAKLLAFNIHGSLLPKYRGRTPHVWAIINGEKQTGITAHIINEGCDTGDVISQVKITINESDTGNDLLKKFNIQYKKLINEVFYKIENNELNLIRQDESLATYFGKRTPLDGQINWGWQKERIRNWVRAQAFPYPGAFTFINTTRLTIDELIFSDAAYEYDMPNGLVLNIKPIRIKTPNGVVELKRIREKIKINIGDLLK